MAHEIPKLSVVCPAYEEEEVLPSFHHELCAVLAQLGMDYEIEILYVDDGSRDRTLAVLRELAAGDPRVRYLSFSRNFGHQAALTAGLEHARGDVVITLDSDLQHPPDLIPVLLKKWQEGYDVVLTIRAEDLRLGFFKRFTSKLFYRVLRLFSDTEIRLAAADYRLMSRKAVSALLQMREAHRFLRGMVQWLGFPSAEVPFEPARRKAGVSKYSLRRMVNFAVDALLSFSRVPLRLSLLLGLLAAGFGLMYAVYALACSLVSRPSPEPNVAWLLTSVYLIGGCILCVLGLIGEYVGRIYEQVKARPIYLVKETSETQGIGARSGPGSRLRRPYPREREEGNSAA
jgi:polyisoprenyl-phosphate glycosyltransferase